MDPSVERSFEVPFQAQPLKNITVEKGWIHVNLSEFEELVMIFK